MTNLGSILEWQRPFQWKVTRIITSMLMRNLYYFWLSSSLYDFWRFHFEIEIQVNCLFTQCKWTYILDLGPWRWSALNMGFVDKWPSRMQGQWFFQNRVGGQQFLVGYRKSRYSGGAVALARIFRPQKVRGGELNVLRIKDPKVLSSKSFKNEPQLTYRGLVLCWIDDRFTHAYAITPRLPTFCCMEY